MDRDVYIYIQREREDFVVTAWAFAKADRSDMLGVFNQLPGSRERLEECNVEGFHMRFG